MTEGKGFVCAVGVYNRWMCGEMVIGIYYYCPCVRLYIWLVTDGKVSGSAPLLLCGGPGL